MSNDFNTTRERISVFGELVSRFPGLVFPQYVLDLASFALGIGCGVLYGRFVFWRLGFGLSRVLIFGHWMVDEVGFVKGVRRADAICGSAMEAKRACLTTPAPGYEIGESLGESSAVGAGKGIAAALAEHGCKQKQRWCITAMVQEPARRGSDYSTRKHYTGLLDSASL
ncbi:hypothetical protein Tco_1404629 [Tanacetum coccineum]